MGEINWYRYEEEAAREGFRCVCGIDEAGRGPLAGPVFAACVVLRPGEEIEGLNDSKKLSEKKRELLFAEITARAVDYSIAMRRSRRSMKSTSCRRPSSPCAERLAACMGNRISH